MSRITVVEYTDPGCVWSWGSEPQLRWLRDTYGDQLDWRRVFGVQVDDASRSFPDRDVDTDGDRWREDWLVVAETTGAPVPERLEWFHRSTRPAAEAARAAEAQGPEIADRVLLRLREAVFVGGRPADTPARIAEALADVPGLDLPRLLTDAESGAVKASVQADFEETRRPHPAVIGRTGPGPNPGAARQDGDHLRYSFPTLIITGPGGEQVVSGWNDRDALEAAVLAAGARSTADTTA
ncbi:MAG: DsbA family protein [Solirubrobacteraceae bacterium]|nr:DsbA family protein [Patulibacter sp.]